MRWVRGLYRVLLLTCSKNSNKTSALTYRRRGKKPIVPISKYSRKYSTSVKQESTFTTSSGLTLSMEFIEWFRGFTDGEGSFYVHNNKGNQFQFNFEISLHKDDIGAINHIYNSLGIGKVYIKKNRGTFIVRSLDEIKVILEIFSQNPLNTTKHLNFLDFKRAYLIYTKKDSSRGELKEIVANIKSQMNVKRTDYALGKDHVIKVTSNWLLGLTFTSIYLLLLVYFGFIVIDLSAIFPQVDELLYSVTPIFSYSNADRLKKQIIKDSKGKCGVYRWTNNENGKSYIGSSVNLLKRFYDYYGLNYLTRHEKSSNICKSLLKYGYSAFTLDILEFCERADVREKEQYYMDLLKPDYNILPKAGSLLGYWLGREHSKETRAKIGAKALNQQSCIKVEVLDLETDTKTIYNSLSEAARALNIADRAISQYFTRNQKKPYKGRYIFTKID